MADRSEGPGHLAVAIQAGACAALVTAAVGMVLAFDQGSQAGSQPGGFAPPASTIAVPEPPMREVSAW